MDTLKKRILLFLIGCIGTRFTLVWLAYAYPNLLPILALFAVIVGTGFFVIYFGDLRKTGAEVFGDNIWWNNLRPVHGVLYLAFAYLAFKGIHQHAWKLLLVDVLIGLFAFLHHHQQAIIPILF